ncbi:unnamed protein product, partial [Arabidopsis halleri]
FISRLFSLFLCEGDGDRFSPTTEVTIEAGGDRFSPTTDGGGGGLRFVVISKDESQLCLCLVYNLLSFLEDFFQVFWMIINGLIWILTAFSFVCFL